MDALTHTCDPPTPWGAAGVPHHKENRQCTHVNAC